MKYDFIKGVFWVLIFKISGACSLLFINMLITKGWGVSKVGEFAVITSSLLLAAMLSRCGLDSYIVKFGSRGSIRDVSKLTYKASYIVFISSILVSILFYFSGHKILLVVVIIFYSQFFVLPEVLRALGNSFAYSLIRSFLLNASIFFIIVLCYIFKVEPEFEYIYLLSTFLCLLLFFTKYLQLGGEIEPYPIKYNEVKDVLKETVFMQISSLSIYFLGNFSVLILSLFYTDELVGKYFIIVQMTLIFNLVITSVGIYVGPKLSTSAAAGNWKQFKEYYFLSSFLTSLFLLPILIIYFFWGKALLAGLFNIYDEETYYYLLVMSIGYFLSSLCGPKFSALNMTGNHLLLAKIMFFFLVFGLFLNFISIYFLGFNAFIYISISVNFLLAVSCLLSVKIFIFNKIF